MLDKNKRNSITSDEKSLAQGHFREVIVIKSPNGGQTLVMADLRLVMMELENVPRVGGDEREEEEEVCNQ